MKCAYHTESPAHSACSRCSAWLCDRCAVDINGKFVCKRCVADAINMGSGQNFESSVHHGQCGAPGGSGFTAEHRKPSERAGRKPHRYISGLWILMLSFLPGLNYMALGLIKRGIFFMSAFFGIIYLMSGFHVLVFPLIVLFFASLCDSQSKRRRINNGDYVSDDIYDIISFLSKYRTPLLGVLIFMILSSFVGFGGASWHRHSHMQGFNFLALIVVCVIGWYFIKNRKIKADKDSERRVHSHHDDNNN